MDGISEPTWNSLLFCLGYGTAHLLTANFLVPSKTLAKIASRGDRIYYTEKFFSSLNGLILGSTGMPFPSCFLISSWPVPFS